MFKNMLSWKIIYATAHWLGFKLILLSNLWASKHLKMHTCKSVKSTFSRGSMPPTNLHFGTSVLIETCVRPDYNNNTFILTGLPDFIFLFHLIYLFDIWDPLLTYCLHLLFLFDVWDLLLTFTAYIYFFYLTFETFCWLLLLTSTFFIWRLRPSVDFYCLHLAYFCFWNIEQMFLLALINISAFLLFH